MRRVRRPLLALIALVVAVAIGYGVDALRSGNSPDRAPSRSPSPTVSLTGFGHAAQPLPPMRRS